MPDPFAFFADPSQAALGIAPPAPVATPKPAAPAPAAPQPRSTAATMLAPAAPDVNRPMVYSPQYGTVVFKDTGLPATDAEVQASLSTPRELAKGAPTRAEAEAGAKPADTMGVYLQGLRARESGGNDSAINSTTHATGRYQFLPSTWASLAAAHPELGLRPQDIYDPAKQEQAIRAFTNDNIQILTLNKLPVEPGSLYAMHFLGSGAGPQFLKAVAANPNGDASAMFPAAARANPSVFYAKEGHPRTFSQVYAQMAQSFGGQMASVDPAELKAIASFDKAAGVSPVPQGFTAQQPSNVQTSLTEDPGGLKPLPGMTPIKSTLKPLPGMTPLKLDYASKAPLTSANPYAEGTKTKPEAPTLEIAGVDSNGEPIFADPKAQKEYFDARVATGEAAAAATGEAAAAGLASNITGLAEWDPTDPVNAPAQLSKQLQEIGKKDPIAYKIGEWAPAAIPAGEVFSGAKEAIAGGKALAPTLRSLWESGSKSGLAAGAITSATTATGETDTAKRLNEKAEDVIHGGVGGAAGVGALAAGGRALSAAGSAVAGLGKRLGGEAEFLWSAFSGEAKKAVQELLTGFKTETGQALSADERKIAEAKAAEELKRVKLEKHDAELKKIADAQAQLAERERVRAEQGRDTRQADNPKAAEELRAGVTARARERVRQAENQAKEAGATAEEAKAYAVEQEQKVLDAKTAAQEIAAEFAKNPSTMTKERFGEVVQKAAADMQEKAEEAREEAAGFKEAMQSAPPGPVVKNDRVMKVLDDIDASSADRSVHAITDEIRKQFVTRQRNAEGEWEVVDKSGITVERADSLRKVLNTAMRSRKMAVESGSADASAAQHHIGKVLEALEDATGAAHPPYNEAVKAWRENSRGPLDQFLPKQALGKITKTEDFSGRFAMNEGRVAAEILSQSNQGSEALATLVKQNPEVMAAAEQYLDRQFQTAVGSKATPEKVDKFIRNNESTLDKLGLRKKYQDARDTLADAGKDVKGAEASAEAAKTAAKQAEAQRKALEDVAKQRKSVLERSKTEQPGDVFSPGDGQSKVDPYAGRTRVAGAQPGVDPQKFVQVYDKLKAKQGGFNAVNISDVARELGVPAKDVHEFLKTAAKSGDANLHPSTSVNMPKEVTDAALKLEGHDEPFIATSLSDSGRSNFSKVSRPQQKAFDNAVSERRAAQPVKDPAKAAAEKAKADAARLKEKAAGPEAAKAETQKSIDAIAKERGKAETSRKAYVDFQSRIEEAEKKGTLSNERAIGECKTFLETLRSRDIIDDAKYKEMYGQMQTAIKANDEQKSARWLILKLGAVLAAVGGAGEYVSHRFYVK